MKIDIFNKIKLPFRSKERKLYFDLYHLLGFFPHNIDLYKRAFRHKSASRKDSDGRPFNNERLEFLGDAILGAVVGDIVFHHFPRRQEGFLTVTRSKLVSRSMLNSLAGKLHLKKFIHYHGVSSPNCIPGNALEALIGAIYLDRGFAVSKRFIEKRILKAYVNLDEVARSESNYKGKVIEWANHYGHKVDFVTLEEDPENAFFKSQILVDGKICGEGSGARKRDSQQEAAKTTLEMFKKDSHFLDSAKPASAG